MGGYKLRAQKRTDEEVIGIIGGKANKWGGT